VPTCHCWCAVCCRLKDIIYGFGTNNVYVVLECMDCDLRHLLDAERQLDMRQIKVSTTHLDSQQAGPAFCIPFCTHPRSFINIAG